MTDRPPNTPPRPSTSNSGRRPLPPPTPSEAAFERLLADFETVDESAAGPAPESPGAGSDGDAAFLDALFAHRGAYLERDRYASIGEADAFHTKVVGVTFEGRQDVAGGLVAGEAVRLVREPENPHDPNAISVRFGTLALGFLRRAIAKRLAPNIDAGDRYVARIASVTGGGERSVGVNLYLRRERVPVRAIRAEAARASTSTDALRVALIGERPLREAQRAVLQRLEAGRNTLAVLGTGSKMRSTHIPKSF